MRCHQYADWTSYASLFLAIQVKLLRSCPSVQGLTAWMGKNMLQFNPAKIKRGPPSLGIKIFPPFGSWCGSTTPFRLSAQSGTSPGLTAPVQKGDRICSQENIYTTASYASIASILEGPGHDHSCFNHFSIGLLLCTLYGAAPEDYPASFNLEWSSMGSSGHVYAHVTLLYHHVF